MCCQEMSKSSDQDLMMLLPYVQSSQTNARSWPPQQQAQLPGAASCPAFQTCLQRLLSHATVSPAGL